jgi:H/ACA ribonucleoprotein complex subunit 2
MAKERSTEKEERRSEKKEKKEKRSEKDGVHKSKKDKKEKKTAPAVAEDTDPTQTLLDVLTNGDSKHKEADIEEKVKAPPLLGALVPFANPLADEKVGKKVLKSVKKGIESPTDASPAK